MLDALIRHCVSRRIAAVMVTIVFAIYGVYAYLNTPIEAYPDVTNVQVTVISAVPGLAPEEVERQITIPLERALNGTPGMTLLRSESLFGLSLVSLIFDDNADSFRSRALVNERLVGAELPDGVVPELAPDYTPLGRIYYYKLVSDRHTLHDLRAEQEWTVARVLRQVPGVADVSSLGGYLKEYQIVVNPERLHAFGLSLLDVTDAIQDSNVNVGGGFLRFGEQELVIRSIGYLASAGEIRDIVLKSEGGIPVTVGDVAQVVLSHTPRRGAIGVDEDIDVVQGIVFLRRGENPSVVLNGVHEKVRELNSGILPDGMSLEPIYDRSDLVGHTMKTVHNNLFHGALLIIGLVWLFLRSLRGSLIVATVIPLSLMTAFIGLYLLGLPANLISMGAIDFGILVDGAVVLVENVIHKARLHKPSTRKAMLKLVVKSAVDVARPTFYAMAIIIAALIPVFTLESVEGRIFQPLALTYSFALAGALVFALTIVPALCALLIRPRDALVEDPAFITKLTQRYRLALDFAMQRRAMVIACAGVLMLSGIFVGSRLGTEFLPELDEGDVYVFVEMPPSISLQEGQQILLEVRRRLLQYPEVSFTLAEQGRPEDGLDNEGVNMAKVFVGLKSRDTWAKGVTKESLVESMRRSLAEIPGVSFNFSQMIKDTVEEAVAGVRGQVVLKVYGPDLELMRDILLQAIDVLRPIEGIVDLDLYRDSTVPQLQVRIDRSALAREGISMAEVQEVIETALAGQVVTEMWEGERPVPLRVQLPFSERANPTSIKGLPVATPSGGFVPLSDLASIEIAMGRTVIPRESNSRYLALKFNVDGRDMGSVIQDAIAAVEANVEVSDGHFLQWGGEFENQQRAMARLKMIIPISLLIILLLLYGALGTGRASMAILISTPFALTGGVFALYFTGIDLSVSAAIGFIALLGQMSLLGLLVLSAIDAYRVGEPKMKREEAILEGATERFRAVLMAALLASMGLMPMAISSGLGSETQKPFAVVIVGGMVTTLAVAIFLLPVFYSFIARRTPKVLAIDPDEEEGDANE